jgi:hypothetical protein
MRTRLACVAGVLFLVCWASVALSAQPSRVILVLGNASFINPTSVQQATGAEVSQDPGTLLTDVAVLVLANTPFSSLPQSIQDGLADYVGAGGAVLITGGPQSFGSGGYKAVAPIIPFQMRSDSDWRFIAFRPPIALQPGHPILAGVSFITVGTVNDMNPRPDATEILQSAGGGTAGSLATPRGGGGGGGGTYIYPLICELAVGAGRVIGIAFDLNDFAGMRDRDLFVQNTLTYLLAASRMGVGR